MVEPPQPMPSQRHPTSDIVIYCQSSDPSFPAQTQHIMTSRRRRTSNDSSLFRDRPRTTTCHHDMPRFNLRISPSAEPPTSVSLSLRRVSDFPLYPKPSHMIVSTTVHASYYDLKESKSRPRSTKDITLSQLCQIQYLQSAFNPSQFRKTSFFDTISSLFRFHLQVHFDHERLSDRSSSTGNTTNC